MGHLIKKSLAFGTVTLTLLFPAMPAQASFGIHEFEVTAANANGSIDAIAASHPFAFDFHLAMNRDKEGQPEGLVRTIELDLPPGLTGNALAVPRCSLNDFDGQVPQCPVSTQIGIIRGAVTGLGQITLPVYNLTPSPGEAGAFGAGVNGISVIERLSLRGVGAGSGIHLTATLPGEPAIVEIDETIWGVPADPIHDSERTCPSFGGSKPTSCPAEIKEAPLLTLPSSCEEPMRTTFTATSAETNPLKAVATAFSRDAGGTPQPLIGCDAVPFDPRLTVRSEGAALAPTGWSLGIEVPQYEGAESTGAANVGAVRVELPAGLALNPSAGSWLESCAVAMDDRPASCPPGSRIGSVRLETPSIDHELEGAIYLAPPETAAAGSRLGIYLVVEDSASGTQLKIPGRIEADPGDGRLTATVSDLPRFAFQKLELEFAGGPRAPLASPPRCGRYTTVATLAPTTVPFDLPATRSSTFVASTGAGGASCPPPEAERGTAPSFHAGLTSPSAGGGSSFGVSLSRTDLDQHFGSFDLALPPGLIADLGSTPIGAAVGGVEVKAGLGPEPLSLSGTAYLGGPYRAAPYSLTFVVPAKAGPIDLGTIVQRAAVDVDPVTAQISVRSDPLPQILGGVPLELRSLRLDLDRPGFIRTPTSCEPTAIAGTATTSLGQSAPISDRFQVGGCAALPFKPRLSLALSGAVGRGGHPAVRAVYHGDPSGAAASGMAFRLPAGELLDLRHLGRLCPRDVEAARCPRDSRLGSLRIVTPLLDAPLDGPIYLRVPSGRLPGLTAEVRSGGLHFLLRGRVTGRRGRLGVSLESLPDVPLSRAVLRLPGGRRGLVVNSESLCRARRGAATAHFSAHSGKQRSFRLRPQVVGCSRKR